MTKQMLNMLFSSVFCLLLSTTSCQAEETQQPLTQLSNKLNRLEWINNQSRMELNGVKVELTTLKEESTMLRNELRELRIISTRQEYSLTKANRLLEDYKKETERKIQILRMQRTLAYTIVGIVAIALI